MLTSSFHSTRAKTSHHTRSSSPTPNTHLSFLFDSSVHADHVDPGYTRKMSRAAATVKASAKVALPLYRFESAPKPINITTFTSTQQAANDGRHPHHIKIQRRLQAWNPNKLYWAIRAPLALSTKRAVRVWAVRRYKAAFVAELKRRGYGSSGELLEKASDVSKGSRSKGLKGALAVTVDPSTITAPYTDVQEACKWLLRKIVSSQKR